MCRLHAKLDLAVRETYGFHEAEILPENDGVCHTSGPRREMLKRLLDENRVHTEARSSGPHPKRGARKRKTASNGTGFSL